MFGGFGTNPSTTPASSFSTTDLKSRPSVSSPPVSTAGGGGVFGQTPANTTSVFGAPKPATGFGGTGSFGSTGFGSTPGPTTTGAFGQQSSSTTGTFGSTGIFGSKPAFGTSEHVPSIILGRILTCPSGTIRWRRKYYYGDIKPSICCV